MEIKTIRDLKNLIGVNMGLKIGCISFEYPNEGGDIDIELNGQLLAWFDKPADETLLEDVNSTVSSDFTGLKEKIDGLKEEKREIEIKFKEIETERNTLLEIKKSGELALGKVEAYEKLLIGRDLNISK